MTTDERIAQFRKATETDPNDELAHFSLGMALVEAKQFDEAGPCFQRVIAINPQSSAGYLQLGKVQRETGHASYAIQTLTHGYRVAHKRGDLKPRNEMAELLRALGAPVPDLEQKAAPSAAVGGGAAGFSCSRCGGSGPRLRERPFKGPLGERILANVCEGCWKEWIGMGTKVINELRLPMYDPQAQELFDKHMKEFLGLLD